MSNVDGNEWKRILERALEKVTPYGVGGVVSSSSVAPTLFLCEGPQEILVMPSRVVRPARITYPTGSCGEYLDGEGRVARILASHPRRTSSWTKEEVKRIGRQRRQAARLEDYE